MFESNWIFNEKNVYWFIQWKLFGKWELHEWNQNECKNVTTMAIIWFLMKLDLWYVDYFISDSLCGVLSISGKALWIRWEHKCVLCIAVVSSQLRKQSWILQLMNLVNLLAKCLNIKIWIQINKTLTNQVISSSLQVFISIKYLFCFWEDEPKRLSDNLIGADWIAVFTSAFPFVYTVYVLE